MNHLKRDIIIGILFVLITGTLSHFLYDWTGQNPVIGLFTPINESIWEHMKLLFFPMLFYALILVFRHKENYPCIPSALCLGILAGTILIPVFYYSYKALLGRDIFILDIAAFIVSVILSFRLSYKLTLSCRLNPLLPLLCLLMGVFLTCFILFTYHPPDLTIFEDPLSTDDSESPQIREHKQPQFKH